MTSALQKLKTTLSQRIVLLDGAYGTVLQEQNLDEEAYRSGDLQDHATPLSGNYDVLCLTQPQIVADAHRRYLQAGADIIKTNSFGATAIAQTDYALQDRAVELNAAAASIARACVDEYSTDQWPRYVAGVLGPTNRTASLSPDVNDPGFRNTSFAELADGYYESARALLANGAHLILLETIFDTLNAKAAIFAIHQFSRERGAAISLMI